MIYLIISLVALGLIAAVLGYLRNKKFQQMLERGEITKMPEVQEIPDECCGEHEVCERESLLAVAKKKIDYYEDEDLDRFKDIPSDAYELEEVEEFREVLYTLQEKEVAGWLRSLQLRTINLPDALKDEAFLIVQERRLRTSNHS